MPTNPQAEAKAEEVLAAFWPERRIPVKPSSIATLMGADVFERKLDPSVSGAIVKEAGRSPTIVINSDEPEVRKRFTCAHELGHFVEKSGTGDAFEYVDFRSQLSADGTDASERFANAFAAALLMPSAEVTARVEAGASVMQMAADFGVSVVAMEYRIQNLGLRA